MPNTRVQAIFFKQANQLLNTPKTLRILQRLILQNLLYFAQQPIGARLFGAANLLPGDERFLWLIERNSGELFFLPIQSTSPPCIPIRRGIFRGTLIIPCFASYKQAKLC